MILYLDAKTNISDLMIDYIEVKLKSGKEVSLNWDESGISRDTEGFSARYKGVCFGNEYANGRIDELDGLEITSVGLYTVLDEKCYFEIESMEFYDNGKTLKIDDPGYIDSDFEVSQAKILQEILNLTKTELEIDKDSSEDLEYNIGYTMPDGKYHLFIYVDRIDDELVYVVEPNKLIDGGHEPIFGDTYISAYGDYGKLMVGCMWAIEEFERDNEKVMQACQKGGLNEKIEAIETRIGKREVNYNIVSLKKYESSTNDSIAPNKNDKPLER